MGGGGRKNNMGCGRRGWGGGGVRRVRDVVRVGDRKTSMGCCRSGRGVRQVWDLIGVGVVGVT